MPRRNGCKTFHIGGQPSEMNRENSPVTGRNGGFDLRGIEVERKRVYIDQDGPGVEVADDLGGGGKGKGGSDDFITGFEADGFECQMHGGGAGVDGDGVFGTDIGGKVLLELASLGAGGDPARADGFGDFVDFVFVSVWEGEGKVGGTRHMDGCGLAARQESVERLESIPDRGGRLPATFSYLTSLHKDQSNYDDSHGSLPSVLQVDGKFYRWLGTGAEDTDIALL